MVGAISFRYSWTTGMKKKFRNLVLKKGQISGFAQIDIFLISNFFGYLSITFFKTIQKKVGYVLKNSGNLQQDGHKNF